MTSIAVTINDGGFAIAADAFVGTSSGGLQTADKLYVAADRRPVALGLYGRTRPLGLSLTGQASRLMALPPLALLRDYPAQAAERLRDVARANGGHDTGGQDALDRAAAAVKRRIDAGEPVTAISATATSRIWCSAVEDKPSARLLERERIVSEVGAEIGASLSEHGLEDDATHRSAVAAVAAAPAAQGTTGLVWVGAGPRDPAPQIAHMRIGSWLGSAPVVDIALEDVRRGAAFGYAQNDGWYLMNFGVHAAVYRGAIESHVELMDLLESQGVAIGPDQRKAAADAAKRSLDETIASRHIKPFGAALATAMPRDLAAMALTMVQLTAITRRLDSPTPTVTSPFSVAYGPLGGPVVLRENARTLDL